ERCWNAVTFRSICPILHPGRSCSKAQSAGRRYLMTIRARFRSQSPLPTPSTLRNSSGFLNGPWVSRYSTIFSATRRPKPSSFISSLTSVVWMLTGAPAGADPCVYPGRDGGAATTGHGARHENATSRTRIAGRKRLMKFLLRSGARHSRALASDAIEPAVGGTRQRPIIQTPATDTDQSRDEAWSRSRYACHSTGTSEFFFELHSLQAGTTLPRV